MKPICRSQRASSLVTSLLVIVVLAVIVTALMQSMSTERQTARSYSNKFSSELAAEAGVNAAISNLRELFQQFPDSCTAWTEFSNTRGTSFYYRGLSVDSPAVPSNATAQIFAVPLISGATAQRRADISQINHFGGPLDATNSLDLNRLGWLDQRSTSYPEIRAKWVNVLQDPSRPEDLTLDPSTGRPRNPPVGRYAYWIEDESFRLNVNQAGSTPRGDQTLGASPSELEMQATFDSADVSMSADDILTLREALADAQFITPSQVVYSKPATDSLSETERNSLRYFITGTSSGLNLSRSGAKRLNLNQVVQDSIDPEEIRVQLDKIISAITQPDAMPDFGQRFYRTTSGYGPSVGSQVSQRHAEIYLQKLAANIRDYIDTDFQPTVIANDSNFSVLIGAPPVTAPGFSVVANNVGDNDVAAIGKEPGPGLMEYAFRVTLFEFSPQRVTANAGAGANYHCAMDHYFKFVNMTNRDVELADLGPNPYLQIYNQFGWSTGGAPPLIPPGRLFQVPLSGFMNGAGEPIRFPAGQAVIVTTDASPSPALVGDPSAVFRPDGDTLEAIKDDRIFAGVTRRSTNNYRLNPEFGSAFGRAGTDQSDYDTHMLIGNDHGLIVGFTALPMPQNLSVNNDTGDRIESQNYFFRGGSLRGNNGTGSQTGDPRSINEQLQIQRHRAGADEDKTRFFDSELNNNSVPGKSALEGPSFLIQGRNSVFFNLANWLDYSPQNFQDAETAQGVVANAPMRSIGELGHIYDPARVKGPQAITFSRGGARTLRIGQSDRFVNTNAQRGGLWNGEQTGASRNRAAWRLADVFSTTGELETQGLINVNGALRDGGAVFRAAVSGLRFMPSPDSDPNLAGRDANVDEVVAALLRRFPALNAADADPLWERGELSELALESGSLFSQGNQLAGVNLATTLDRGREEFVRRVMELITTKGNTFTVYCVGQSLQVRANGVSIPQSSTQTKVTFALRPVFEPAVPEDGAVGPLPEDYVETRFRGPDRFEVDILAIETL